MALGPQLLSYEGDITMDYLKQLEESRNSMVTRQNSLANLDVIGLHNQHAYK
ncbi:hypothetical protein HDU96_005330 [Phlyctochytrium bullatum]|nr:hypothetical protein HDU96_005330 [Phlyctochytrium bullatum]